jgi:hypothetical protein
LGQLSFFHKIWKILLLTETNIKIIKLIFDIENWLWKSNFGDFCRLIPKWTHVQSQKLLAGSNSWAKISIWWAVQLCAQKVRSCYSRYNKWKNARTRFFTECWSLLQVLNHSNLTHLKINLELIIKLLILPWAGHSNFESYKKWNLRIMYKPKSFRNIFSKSKEVLCLLHSWLVDAHSLFATPSKGSWLSQIS